MDLGFGARDFEFRVWGWAFTDLRVLARGISPKWGPFRRSQAHKKTWSFEVAELVFDWVSRRFHVLGEGLATSGRIRKATLMFRNVVITVVSVLFY